MQFCMLGLHEKVTNEALILFNYSVQLSELSYTLMLNALPSAWPVVLPFPIPFDVICGKSSPVGYVVRL